MNNFDIFRFKPFINEALTAKGFKQPTEVQERLIPLIAKGKNIIGQSQTGTGKTHTFLLPLFEKINAEKEEVHKFMKQLHKSLNFLHRRSVSRILSAVQTNSVN